MHPNPDFLPARGIQFARLALARAAGSYLDEQIDFAAKRWGQRSTIVQMLKTDVSGHEAADSTANVSATFEQAAEFGEVVDSQGLLRGLSSVPANVPFIGAVTDPSSAWVGQSKAVPVSRAVLDRSTMQPLKIGSLLVLTNELIRSADPRVPMLVLGMMARSARLKADAAIADPSNTGDAATPAAVTSAATPISSTDDIVNDADAAIAAYGGSLETAVWWMHPRLAAQAGLRAGAGGAGADLGVKGGSLAGITAYCSAGVPAGTLILVDRASVAMLDEGYEVVRSTQGTVEMSDAPQGATDTPVTMSTKFVSLFQSDAVGPAAGAPRELAPGRRQCRGCRDRRELRNLTMSDDDLQQRFADALRRALEGAQAGVPAVHVDVQPAAVSISPVIRATLPMPEGPIEVLDVGRQNGAYEFRMRVTRNAEGLITDATVSPEKFIPLESFK